MKFSFKPEDFKMDDVCRMAYDVRDPTPDGILRKIINEHAARQANALLDAHLETLKVVYGSTYRNKLDQSWRIRDVPSDTHRAYLFDAEEIEHSPGSRAGGEGSGRDSE